MRLTPAQLAVHLLCGRALPGFPDSIDERIASGRKALAGIAKADFGYDLERWHEHLKNTRDGGYTWNRTVVLPRVMRDALASEAWRAAVERLRARDSSPSSGMPPSMVSTASTISSPSRNHPNRASTRARESK